MNQKHKELMVLAAPLQAWLRTNHFNDDFYIALDIDSVEMGKRLFAIDTETGDVE